MSDFFAVGRRELHEACSLGLNAAVSFLVMACGTGHDNQTTAWSANAVQKYGGISAKRAKFAITALIDVGIIEEVGGTRTKPRYKLRISKDRIWLPKCIVMPLAHETPPVARIRQTQDAMLLRLFVDLYYVQDLSADGGLPRLIYCRKYEKAEYWEHGQYIFLGFEPSHICTHYDHAAEGPHCIEVSKTGRQARQNEAQEFSRSMTTLRDLGLLEESACLFESGDTDAEMLYPLTGPTEREQTVRTYVDAIVETVLPEWHIRNNPYEYLVPVYRHQQKAEMFGIFRMRHRPHTNTTSAWQAILHTKIEDAIRFFKKIRS